MVLGNESESATVSGGIAIVAHHKDMAFRYDYRAIIGAQRVRFLKNGVSGLTVGFLVCQRLEGVPTTAALIALHMTLAAEGFF